VARGQGTPRNFKHLRFGPAFAKQKQVWKPRKRGWKDFGTIFFENRAENAGSKEPAFFGQIGPAFLRKAGLEAPVSAETGAGRSLGPFSVGKRAGSAAKAALEGVWACFR